MLSNINTDLAYYKTAMDLRVQRQQIIASNIANADTPQYKARDFDFTQALKGAMYGQQQRDLALNKTASRHIDGSGGVSSDFLKYRTEKQSSVDGNTVDMDVERAAIAENSMQYELLTRLISDKFSGLKSALSSPQG